MDLLSLADLKALITASGRSHHDCATKSDLVRRLSDIAKEVEWTLPNQPNAHDVARRPPTSNTPVFLIILVGVPGSGKSYLARQLVNRAGSTQVTRCCQDMLGSRAAVEDLASASMAEGRSVIIDRTNMNRQQRSHWFRIAQQTRACVCAVVFRRAAATCVQRANARVQEPGRRRAAPSNWAPIIQR